MVSAGIGLKKIRSNGEKGNWSLKKIHIYFRLPTILNVIPIILFSLILLFPKKETKERNYLETIEQAIPKVKYDSLILKQEKINVKLTIENTSKLDTIIRHLLKYEKQNMKGGK